jgi:hypothetical protein
MFRTLFSLAFLALLSPVVSGQTPPATQTAPAPVDAGVSAYRKVLGSSVWIHSNRGKGRLATGSGSLVDRGRRLVLTNYHVVGDVKRATVFFPDYGPDRRAIPERKHYLDRADRLGIPGEVVEVDKEGDLALIRLDRVPAGVPELSLASSSPEPGQAVHSIGNPGKSGALWVYTPGKVRQVYAKKWQAKLDEKTVQTFRARVIETDSPTNPGDSGGPLVNDRGELVGITQGGAIDAQALSIFVDLSEVKRLLGRRSIQALRSEDTVAAATEDKKEPEKKEPEKKEPAKPIREKPLESKDGAKVFSEAAWMKVHQTAEKLLKEKNMDLLIETIPSVPQKDLERVKAMKPEEREKYFKEYAIERAKAEKMKGIYVVVCRSPGFMYVDIHSVPASNFPAGFGSKLTSILLTRFKEKKFDQGLEEGLNYILESVGLGEKK